MTFFEECVDHHLKWMVEVKEPKILSVLFMKKDADKKIAVVPIHILTPDVSPLDVTKNLVTKSDPDSYLIISEAWLKTLDKELYDGLTDDQLLNMFKRGEIEKMSDKREALMVIGRHRNGKDEYIKQFLIIRNEKHHVIGFEEMKKGRFVTRKLP